MAGSSSAATSCKVVCPSRERLHLPAWTGQAWRHSAGKAERRPEDRKGASGVVNWDDPLGELDICYQKARVVSQRWPGLSGLEASRDMAHPELCPS